MAAVSIEHLWQEADFSPNPNQEKAILHTDGPLYLPAGPGSGKTRVLLWRTVNLIVFHNISPDEIYLATFTEKAALQLKEGLRALLSLASKYTGQPYDIANMYIGTVHALCGQLIRDRRFAIDRARHRPPSLLDEIDQHFFLNDYGLWQQLTSLVGFDESANQTINQFFDNQSKSKFVAVQNCLRLFNRLSEECIDPAKVQVEESILAQLMSMYAHYRAELETGTTIPRTDLSLLQQKALETIAPHPNTGYVFRHIIIDEYQDTNTIQEQLYFTLAAGHKNLCVVGDDDQALYRFRGATVENFVEFPQRCQQYLGVAPTEIPLNINYRSRPEIVHFYNRFILTDCDWRKAGQPNHHYRVTSKNIQPHQQDDRPAVLCSAPKKPEPVFAEIATLVRQIIDGGYVSDPNQVAFLFPSLKSTQVPRMMTALEEQGLLTYAPRAGRFLEVAEATALFGLMFQVLGQPAKGNFSGRDYNDFHKWVGASYTQATDWLQADPLLAQYVHDRQAEIQTLIADYQLLNQIIDQHDWELTTLYNSNIQRVLLSIPNLPTEARRVINNRYLNKLVDRRREEGRPIDLKYIITRATSLDWTVLDLFYRLCGFQPFRDWFDLAEQGTDEGPVCNLSLVSQYLARFVDNHSALITAQRLDNGWFLRQFSNYLYTLYRLGESEYEDAEDPFPRGRIPFLTIHQSKGLEFPVVVLPNPRKEYKTQKIEELITPLVDREGEPLDKSGYFDSMRVFYVALSRAKNLLVLGHLKGRGQTQFKPFKTLFEDGYTQIADFDVTSLPRAEGETRDLPKSYSYTADYLLYQKCPRQYMLFRKYGFAPSSTQTMFFGSLIHQTLEDLHQFLIAERMKHVTDRR